jgi:hypothetical protein
VDQVLVLVEPEDQVVVEREPLQHPDNQMDQLVQQVSVVVEVVLLNVILLVVMQVDLV